MGLVLLRVLALQGLIVPVRIAGPSMAPTLVGDHFAVTCNDCQFPYRCDNRSVFTTGRVVCPNCGYGQPCAMAVKRGDRVLVDRLAYAFGRPQRGDVVALHDPEGRLSVKRIVGLPGEHVAIRQGNLYVNGRIVYKSLTDFRRVATLVHDDTYRPRQSRQLPARWDSEHRPSGWRLTESGYRFTPPLQRESSERARQAVAIDELTYRNWRCYSTAYPRTEEVPISDHCPYRQAESRQLRDVTDILVSCRLHMDERAELQLRIHDGIRQHLLRLLPSEGCAVLKETARFQIPFHPNMKLEFGLFDHQIVFAVDGSVVTRFPNQLEYGASKSAARPIGFHATGGAVAITNLQVYRDVYYVDPENGATVWGSMTCAGQPSRSGEDTYLVLGDNPWVSADSRYWSPPRIGIRRLRGKVLKLPW